MTHSFVRFSDPEGSERGIDMMTWPNPNDPTEVQWRLRYGNPTKSDLLVAASFMQSYAYLIELDQRTRNKRIASIRKACMNAGSES